MKDIKSYVIGFLTCACLFLIMGQTKQDVMKDIKTLITENGRYQAVEQEDLLYLIDTKTGDLFWRNPNWKTDGENTPKWINTNTTFLDN